MRPTIQTVAVSDGAREYTWSLTITETTGKDIAAVAVQLSLGGYAEPAEWRAPDVDEHPDTSSRVVQMLITAAEPGTYYLWSKVTDEPEVVIRRHAPIVIT